MLIWDIIGLSVGSLFWGVVIALLSIGLFVFIITNWWKDAAFSVMSYVIGAVLFFLLSIQCTLIVGSLKIIDTTDEYEKYFTQIVGSMCKSWEQVSEAEVDEVFESALADYPLLRHYFGSATFIGYRAYELPAAMAAEMRSYMRAYIVRRLLWCLGFVLVASVLTIKTLERRGSGYCRDHGSRRTSSVDRTRQSAGGYRRTHVNTRRR